MKSFAILLGLGLALPSAYAANPWFTDFPAAVSKARSENKVLFVNFTGSDWCGWCIRLKREILATSTFESYASNHLVLVEIDFPKRKTLSPAQQQANQALAQKYGVQGFPTLFVLDSAGKVLGQLGFEPGGPKGFLASLDRIIGPRKTMEAKPPAAASAAPAPAWPPANSPPPVPTSNLILKGVSGPPGKRVALINDRSLTAGEGGVIQLADRRVKLHCLKVNEKSVLVKVDNHPNAVELKLREGL